MNNCVFLGRLTADPEVKVSGKGKEAKKFVTFSIAVSRPYTKDKTDFINCIANGVRAKTISTYFKKGDRICVVGVLTQTVKNNDSSKISYYTLNVNDFDFIETKKDSDKKNKEVDEEVNEDELPF